MKLITLLPREFMIKTCFIRWERLFAEKHPCGVEIGIEHRKKLKPRTNLNFSDILMFQVKFK